MQIVSLLKAYDIENLDKGTEDLTLTAFDTTTSDQESDFIYNIGDKNVGAEAADGIAKALSHKTRLQELYLYNNNLKTIGMIKIAKALQNISTLKIFSIGCNNIG